MSSYIVNFHPSLTQQQIQELLSAIRLLQGVSFIGEAGGMGAGKADDLLNMDFSSKSQQSSYQPPNSMDSMGQSNVPPNSSPMNYQTPPNPAFAAAPNTVPALDHQATPQQAEEQRKMITEIIKWGVHNKKISMQQLESSSTEGTIEMAKKLIVLMPNSDREKILKG